MKNLIKNINLIHTTPLGVKRIKKNLDLDIEDVVDWCKTRILNPSAVLEKKGKNYYVTVSRCIITINSSNYTIITAHKLRRVMGEERAV